MPKNDEMNIHTDESTQINKGTQYMHAHNRNNKSAINWRKLQLLPNVDKYVTVFNFR